MLPVSTSALAKKVRSREEGTVELALAAHELRRELIDGRVGAALSCDGKPLMLFDFTVEDGKILAIRLVADPARLAGLDIVVVEG